MKFTKKMFLVSEEEFNLLLRNREIHSKNTKHSYDVSEKSEDNQSQNESASLIPVDESPQKLEEDDSHFTPPKLDLKSKHRKERMLGKGSFPPPGTYLSEVITPKKHKKWKWMKL